VKPKRPRAGLPACWREATLLRMNRASLERKLARINQRIENGDLSTLNLMRLNSVCAHIKALDKSRPPERSYLPVGAILLGCCALIMLAILGWLLLSS
jgi:type VI protein secretion system component VasF